MSFEQAVVNLEQTNAALQQEVVRFRDAAMGLNRVYPTITEGRQAVADGQYFSIPGSGAYMRLYRRQGTSATLIAEYPSVTAMESAINAAVNDAVARAEVVTARAEQAAYQSESNLQELLDSDNSAAVLRIDAAVTKLNARPDPLLASLIF